MNEPKPRGSHQALGARIALLKTQARYAQTVEQRIAAERELRRLGLDLVRSIPS